MSADAGKVAAVVAVEVTGDLVGRLADRFHAVAGDHGGSTADAAATFGSASDALLAVAALLSDFRHARCGVVFLDGPDVAAAASVAGESAREAELGQTVVSAMRDGTSTRLGVLHGNLESLVIAKAMAQEPVTADLAATDDDVRSKLSPAEYRVAEAVGQGATNKEVAKRLFISAKTVDYHLQNIYRKLGARSRTHLAVLVAGSNRGSVEPPLSQDQLRFLQALADQPGVARWGSGVRGIDLPDETGD